MAVPKPMKLRNVRMPDALWEDLGHLASIRDQRTADLVRGVLEAEVRRNRKAIDAERATHDPTPSD